MKNLIKILFILFCAFSSYAQVRTTSGDAIRKEITPKYVNGLIKQVTIAQLRGMTINTTDSSTAYYTKDISNTSVWKLDASDNSSVDDGTLVIVTANGKRLKKTLESVLPIGTSDQVILANKTLGTLSKNLVHLDSVENIPPIHLPISNAVQTALDTKLNISSAISFAYPKGFYNPTSNSPPLTTIPDPTFEQGAYYEISASGTIAFTGSNFIIGQSVNIGDRLVKIGTQWGLMPYAESSRIKNVEGILSNYAVLGTAVTTNGSYVNSAGTVVTSSSRSYTTFSSTPNDLIKVSAVVNGAIPVAIYKNGSGTVIGTQGIGVNGSDLAFTNYYLTIPSGTATIIVNGNVATATYIYKGTIFSQASTKIAVDSVKASVSVNTSTIANITPVLSQYNSQSVTTTNGYFISIAGTATSSASRSYTSISATTNDSIKVTSQTNGSGVYLAVYKNSAGTVLGYQYQGVDGSNTNYTNQKLTIPSGTATILINGNVGIPILISKYGLIGKTASIDITNALDTRIYTNESKLSQYSSILSSYTPQTTTVIDGAYSDYNGNIVSNGFRRYTTFSATQGDSIRVSTVINGSATYMATYKNSGGIVISRQNIGIDGTDTPYTDALLVIPSGTTTVTINGMLTAPIIVKKLTLISKSASTLITDGLNTRVSTLENTTNTTYKSILSDYNPITTTVVDGSYSDYNGNPITNGFRRYTTFSAIPSDSIKITTTINGSATYMAMYRNSSGIVFSRQNIGVDGSNTNYVDYKLTIPAGTASVTVNGMLTTPIVIKKLSLITRTVSQQYVDNKLATLAEKPLTGKTVLFLGTSITEGSEYATDAPAKLGGTGINKGKGSSTVRISRADGSYTGLAWQNYCYSLAQTLAEKDYIINNWSTVSASLTNSPPTTMDSATATDIRNCSYERRLLPYLNGTLPAPDYFVFEHGRNDNFSSDTDIQFTTVPTNRVDRRTYIGAMNFLIDLIVQYKPYARIAIQGHYENDLLTRVSTAQMVLADYWNIPINKMWEKTGFSQQLSPGSQSLWSQSPWNLYTAGQNTSVDMNRQRVWLPDGIHLHSATNGKAQTLMTDLTADFLKTFR